MLLAAGSELLEFQLEGPLGRGQDRLRSLVQLEGIEEVDAMAYDPESQELLVVDNSQDLLKILKIEDSAK